MHRPELSLAVPMWACQNFFKWHSEYSLSVSIGMLIKGIQQTYFICIFCQSFTVKINSCYRNGGKREYFCSLKNLNQNTRLNAHFSRSRGVSSHVPWGLMMVKALFSFSDLKKPLHCEIGKPAASSTLPGGQKPRHWPGMPKSLDKLCK